MHCILNYVDKQRAEVPRIQILKSIRLNENVVVVGVVVVGVVVVGVVVFIVIVVIVIVVGVVVGLVSRVRVVKGNSVILRPRDVFRSR